MQGTVLTFDAESGGGTVVADSGATIGFDGDAFAAGGLRMLRPGQRVRLARSESGAVESITISTLGPTDAERDQT